MTTQTLSRHLADIIHATVVCFVTTAATVYALVTTDHSGNVWIVYGSAIAFAAGRAGAALATRSRAGDANG